MDTHKEFTLKQQVVFYVVSTLLVATCVYFDFKNDNYRYHKETQVHSTTMDSVNKHLSSYEVTHSILSRVNV